MGFSQESPQREGSQSDASGAYRFLLRRPVLVALVVLRLALLGEQFAPQSELPPDKLAVRLVLLRGPLAALAGLHLDALALRVGPGASLLVGIALFEDTVRFLDARDAERSLRSSPCIGGTTTASLAASAAASRPVVLLDEVIKILVFVVHSYFAGCLRFKL